MSSDDPLLETAIGTRGARYVTYALYLIVFASTLILTAVSLATLDCVLEILNYGPNLVHVVPDGMSVKEFIHQKFTTCTMNSVVSVGVVVTSTAVAFVTTISTYYLTDPDASLRDLIPNALLR